MSDREHGIRIGELFAGVGGFRLALEGFSDPGIPQFTMPSAGDYEVVWANQWEPPGSERKQYAWRCYEHHFGADTCVNKDISNVLTKVGKGEHKIPDIDLLVGGFPCQDYSVAKPLRWTQGIEGEKGRLWWVIHRVLRLKEPKYILLENVDRLIRGKASNCGRDFAMILSSLNMLGYSVEWRVINAADYGYPQKRRRVYIFGVKGESGWSLESRMLKDGVLAEAFPVEAGESKTDTFPIPSRPGKVPELFPKGMKASPFQNAGVMQNGQVSTCKVKAVFDGKRRVLKDVLIPASEVPESFYIPKDKLPAWEECRKAKKDKRTNRDGIEYIYSEGAMKWPDPVNEPARTILTGEGGASASRMKHAIRDESGRVRRLVPDELDMLQGFPKGWTDTGMTDGQRAFCMGNALVVQIPHEIGKVISKRNAGGNI